MQTVLRNGVVFNAGTPDLIAELRLFLHGPSLQADPFWRPEGSLEPAPSKLPYVGEGRFEHARAFDSIAFPKSFEYQDWSERATRAFCSHQWTAITGCGGSSKSTSAAVYALKWWLAAPNDSAVLIASTTIDGAKRRIWKPLSAYYNELSRKCGGIGETFTLTSPRPCIRASKKDVSHGIFIVPVAKGEEAKAIEFLKGFHPKRLLVIGDEADSISQAIVDVCINLQIGTQEFQTIWLGNDPSMFNPLGKLMEPAIEGGWKAVIAQDLEEWTSTTGVHCLRFDGFKSPNIRDNDKWSGIIRQKDIDAALRQQGGNANTPQIWIMIRGLHPPEGADNTVVSEALIANMNARKGVTWQRGFTLCAALDPAFGGDACIFRTLAHGKDTEGKTRVLLTETVQITIAANSKDPAEYQIARQVIELCKARNVSPTNFILDATGTGRGVASVLKVEWSPSINTCEFGGAPSDMIVSEENPKPAKEEYDRRVTELWFCIREFILSNMIRGLDDQTAKELCSRQFAIKGTGNGKRTCVEKKEDMKTRGLSSPDHADALAAGIELLRLKGINASVKTVAKSESVDALEKYAREADLDSSEECYLEEFA